MKRKCLWYLPGEKEIHSGVNGKYNFPKKDYLKNGNPGNRELL